MEELESSELGTQEYWKSAYTTEIKNFHNYGDPGDIWFGEDSAFRIIRWICKNTPNKNTPIIDIGCGNGYTLIELAKEGYANLLGVDYCEEAIILANKFAEKQNQNIKYSVFDITKDDASKLGKFDIIHDKGTYDAVSLNPVEPKMQRETYIEQVEKLLTDSGYFVITSCNWTEQELIHQFSGKLKLHCIIPTPQFKFGGKVGTVVSSLVLKK